MKRLALLVIALVLMLGTTAFAEKKGIVPRVATSNVSAKKPEVKRIDAKPVEVMGDIEDINRSSDSSMQDLKAEAKKKADDKKDKK